MSARNVIIEQDMEFGASLADMDAEMAAQASAVAIANQMQQLMGPDGLSQDEASERPASSHCGCEARV